MYRPIALAALSLLGVPARLRAQDAHAPVPEARDWSLHVQSTYQVQIHSTFDAPYEGANSFQNRSETRGSFTTTFLRGSPLVDRRRGLRERRAHRGDRGSSRVLGLAGPPNGETYRVDSPDLKANLARVFLRQTFDLGGAREAQEDDENRLQVTGPVPPPRRDRR